MTMTKDDFIAEVYEIAFGDNAINRNFAFDEVIEELKKFSVNALASEEEEEEEERDEEDSVYNYHICRICLKNHDKTEVDCKYCKGKMCVILSQDTTQKRAIQQTLEMYYSKLFK